MSRRPYKFLKYVDRSDVSETFEDEVLNVLEEDNLVMIGLPGVGKSSSARAIAAKYVANKRSAIILSVSRTLKQFRNHVQILEVEGKYIPIIVIELPFNSTDSSELLNIIVRSIDNLAKTIQNIARLTEGVTRHLENAALINKIRDQLAGIIQYIPTENQDIFQYINVLSEAIPYVATSLRIVRLVARHQQENKLEKLERQKMLIVIDDLEDLRPNWNIISRISNYEFRYLFVIRIENPQEYLQLQDRKLATRYLEDMGISSKVNKRLELPPPSHKVFADIMDIHSLDRTSIIDLWNYTGGFPAIALMLWTIGGKEGLARLLKEVRDILLIKNKSISRELPWKEDNLQTRLSYTYYAAGVIYRELKSKNYSYVALSIQSAGVSADELLLFCGCRFRQIYTCNNRNVKEVLEKVFNGRICYPEGLEIQVLDTPCTGDERCRYILEDSVKEGIVNKYAEPWDTHLVRDDLIVNEPAPTVCREGEGRVVYQFSHLFRHIPILLKQLEKDDADLHSELEVARKILLKIMDEEGRFQAGVNARIIFSAYDHLIQLVDDLGGVETTSVNFFALIFSKFPDLGYELRNSAWKLVDIVKDNEISLARLLLAYAQFARQLSYKDTAFSYDFSWKTLDEFDKIKSDDRIVLFLFAYSLPNIAIVLFHSGINTEKLQTRSKELVDKICEICQDSVCLYAKAVVFPYLSEYFHAKGDIENSKILMSEAEEALQSLSELYSVDRNILNWLPQPYIMSESSLIHHKAHIISMIGTLSYYSNNLIEAAKRHQESSDIYKKLRSYEGYISNSDAKLVDDFMSAASDEQFRMALEKMSGIDTEILRWLADRDEMLLQVLPTTILLLNLHGVLARKSLNYIYNQEYERGDNALDTSSMAKSKCIVYALKKMIKGYSNNIEFADLNLRYLQVQEYPQFLKRILFLTSVFFQMLQTGENNTTVSIDGVKHEFNLPFLKNDLMSNLNQLEGGDDFRVFCKIYHDNTDNGLLMESISSMIYFVATQLRKIDGINLLITMHLVNDNLEECLLYLMKTANQSKIPLLKRLLKQMAEEVSKYMKTSSDEERKACVKDLTKAYIRLWYYNKHM
jgi:hypothetical protein